MKTKFITILLVSALGAISQANEEIFQFKLENTDGTNILTLDSTQSIRLLNLLKTTRGTGFSREASAEIKCVQSNPMVASCWVLLPERE
jgi:hypothetical protein